ncbi:MAG: hypothetical protein K6E93_08985 [Bacteroidales bacterium]|jgi:hypothetical protein|nr:hypothetical protein [Bacteroidales bacterium]
MKKIILLVAALICVGTVSATKGGPLSISSTTSGGPALTASFFEDQPDHLEFKYYGFYGIVDYTFMTNLNKTNYEYTDDYVLNGVTAIAGFQWRKESAVGLGVSYLLDAKGSFTQLPVFVELRSHYTRNRVTPYSSVQLGYAIPMGGVDSEPEYTKINEGGLTFGLEAGGRFAIARSIGIHLSVGYQFTQLNDVERGDSAGQPATRLPEYFNNFKFSFGVNF